LRKEDVSAGEKTCLTPQGWQSNHTGNCPPPPGATALLSYLPPANPTTSLEGTYRVTVLGAARGTTTCVQILDNWWGDSPPSHTLVGTAPGVNVTAEVSYAGALACITLPNATSTSTKAAAAIAIAAGADGSSGGNGQAVDNRQAAATAAAAEDEDEDDGFIGLPWFELRTTAVGSATCSSAEDCELNGVCGPDKTCVCRKGWFGPSCGTLDVLPALTRGAWPRYRPNASAPVSFPRQYEPGAVLQAPFFFLLFFFTFPFVSVPSLSLETLASFSHM
jgi:hypothetical protein